MLRQFCSITTGTSGRIYRPKEERRLVFYMKDINLPSPDKYDTPEIVMFLSQVVMHNGFYDDDLEFVQLGHVQIMSSMAPASTLGHHPLATRLAANLRVCAFSYPTMEELIEVYSQMVGAALRNPKYQNMADKAHSLSSKAAEAMVDVYTNTRSKFTVDDHDHYLFNPRDLTLWVLQLLRYIVSVDTFLDAWAYEANRIFRDRLVGAESQDQFDLMLRNAMIQFFNADVDVEKLCYTSMVTFGDDGVPSGDLRRISMADYKKMVEEGLKSYEREVKDMPIDLFQEVMDLFRNEACGSLLRQSSMWPGRRGGGST